MFPQIDVPEGHLSVNTSEDAAARKRKELREKLLRGEEVRVTQEGQVTGRDQQNPGQPSIVVPEGKLASSFYWYNQDPELYREEVAAMRKFYPQFSLQTLDDGRLSWTGLMRPENVRPGAKWHLMAVYEHNHPNNNTYGGSIKIYSIDPDLDSIADEIGRIPHTLRDQWGNLYLCTSRSEDFHASSNYSTTAASALAWAAKWITAFELWLAGDLSTGEFGGHQI